MNIKISLPIVFVVSLVGCTVKPISVTLQNEFDSDSARSMLEEGDNTIAGSAVLRQRDGGVQTCAGYGVILIPRTKYAAERMQHFYNSTTQGFYSAVSTKKYEFVNDSADYHSLRRETVCDAHGFFKFRDVADGSFFVIASIHWEIFTPHSFVNAYTGQLQTITIAQEQGGMMMQEVTVSGGETIEIVLTQ